MSYASQIQSLGDLTAAGTGSALDLSALSGCKGAGIYVFGTFVGTVKIEVSPDGTEWFDAIDEQAVAVTGITAKALKTIGIDALQVRANVTAYTSGTINVRLVHQVGLRWSAS